MTTIDATDLMLRTAIGLTMMTFGIHQLLRPLAWREYIPDRMHRLLPLPVSHFMRSHGMINLILGMLLISRVWPQPVAWATLLWWVSILPFAYRVKWSVGMRDLSIIGAIAAIIILHA